MSIVARRFREHPSPASPSRGRASSFGFAAVRRPRSFAPWVAAAAALVALAAVPSVAAADDDADMLAFHVMTPVTGPFVGATNPIRGVNGGGLPWVIRRGRGHVETDGELVVMVRGLVLADDPAVPAALRLTNPVPSFRAIVSCMSIDASGSAATVNVETGPFPATPAGDATIDATVSLPSPCVAPIVFVTSPGGAWFAATGH